MFLSYSLWSADACRRRPGELTLLFFAFVLLLSSGCASSPVDPLTFGSPALSPDGRLVAIPVEFRGVPGSKLAVLDIEGGALRTFDSPPDQIWHSPSFSPSGDRLVFGRICRTSCTSGRKGYHIGVLDLRTGLDTTETAALDLVRADPIFAPDGRFVVYATRRIGNVDRPWWKNKRLYSRWYSIWTNHIHVLDLETGAEDGISFDALSRVTFQRVLPAGFLNNNTLVLRGLGLLMSTGRGSAPPLVDKLERRTKRLKTSRPIQRGSPEDEDYLYTLAFDPSFAFAPRPLRPVLLDLLETDWVRLVSYQRVDPGLMVSFDTGLMAFADLSEGNPGWCEHDIFVGDEKTVRQATFLRSYMTATTISQSGNRVAFLADDNCEPPSTLRMLDVGTGRVYRTGLRQRLFTLYTAWKQKGTDTAPEKTDGID